MVRLARSGLKYTRREGRPSRSARNLHRDSLNFARIEKSIKIPHPFDCVVQRVRIPELPLNGKIKRSTRLFKMNSGNEGDRENSGGKKRGKQKGT